MGLVAAVVLFAAWTGTLVLLLERGAASMSIVAIALAVLVRTYLTTGLFITAHDAMHGSVSRFRRVNTAIGTIAALLFAAMSYRRLGKNHALHHAAPATSRDPDYFDRSPRFLPWLFTFMRRYTTWPQLVAIVVVYNVLHLRYDDATLWLFWAGPSLLASVQLFYFGTYIPHRPPTDALPHHARTLEKRHWWAMLSCYFFGYHREHHESPRTPWWRLYSTKG